MKLAILPANPTCTSGLQLKEDPEYYVPDLLSDPEHDTDTQTTAAFNKHAKHLHKTEGLIVDAKDLAALMRATNSDGCDDRAMQTEAGLKAIEKKLCKAHSRINRLSRRYMNLFLAYAELLKARDENSPSTS